MRFLTYLGLILVAVVFIMGGVIWAQNGQRGNRVDVFDRLDTNKDGVLSREEFSQARQAVAGRLQKRLRAMDSNNDQMIWREEWTGAAQMFDRLDVNRDGVLSSEDRRQRLR